MQTGWTKYFVGSGLTVSEKAGYGAALTLFSVAATVATRECCALQCASRGLCLAPPGAIIQYERCDDLAPTGMLHALLLDGQGGASDYPWEKISRCTPDDGCLWLHFNFEDAQTRRWMREQSGLNDIACNGLLAGETRPGAISRGANLLIVLRGVNLNAGSEPDDMISVRIWTDGTRIISTGRPPFLSTEHVRDRLKERSGPRDTVSLLVAWTGRIVWRMSDTVDKFEDEVARLEDAVLSGQLEGLRHEIASLRRQAITIRRYLVPQREAFNRICSEQAGWIAELDRPRLKEVADRQSRYLEDIDAVRERAAMAQEELLSRVSEQMNARSYVLTLIAAIFLPLGFFTGLLGINVGGMPGVEYNQAFRVVVAICVGVGVALAVLFRLKRWL